MEWMPSSNLGWLNGWIPLALLTLTDACVFLLFPKIVVKRLFDRSGWSKRQVTFTMIGKLLALGCLVILFFTPLKIQSILFPLGMLVVLLGLFGMLIALFNFKNTPQDEPVSRGLYKISRHPQIVMPSLVILGACVAIGSWSALLLLFLARLFSHFSILAEEEICLKHYGEAYRDYLQQVPRYFLFF